MDASKIAERIVMARTVVASLDANSPEVRRFVDGVTKITDDYYAKNYPNIPTPPVYEVNPGKRYLRIVRKDTFGAGVSAFAFIDRETGDVFKPASWKVPAKHARGNVFSPKSGLEAVNSSGFVHYLR